jgi:hypothetical protein
MTTPTLTKLEAANRQLITAIGLFFADGGGTLWPFIRSLAPRVKFTRNTAARPARDGCSISFRPAIPAAQKGALESAQRRAEFLQA